MEIPWFFMAYVRRFMLITAIEMKDNDRLYMITYNVRLPSISVFRSAV